MCSRGLVLSHVIFPPTGTGPMQTLKKLAELTLALPTASPEEFRRITPDLQICENQQENKSLWQATHFYSCLALLQSVLINMFLKKKKTTTNLPVLKIEEIRNL